jgi:hypothetical protein
MIQIIRYILAVFCLCGGGVSATQPAVRTSIPTITEPTTVPVQYAPEGLSNCDEMQWYRIDAGLPARFDAIGWRESNCRNEESVHTFCCWGYWQMYTSLHLQSSTLRPMMNDCGVYSSKDLDSDTPEDKKRQACAAKALYDVNGFAPWS